MNGGDHGMLEGAGSDRSGVYAPETSLRRPDAPTRGVGVSVRAKDGRGCGVGARKNCALWRRSRPAAVSKAASGIGFDTIPRSYGLGVEGTEISVQTHGKNPLLRGNTELVANGSCARGCLSKTARAFTRVCTVKQR